MIRAGISADYVTPRPVEEWHEDIGDVLWWRFPIDEAPYCGSPLLALAQTEKAAPSEKQDSTKASFGMRYVEEMK